VWLLVFSDGHYVRERLGKHTFLPPIGGIVLVLVGRSVFRGEELLGRWSCTPKCFPRRMRFLGAGDRPRHRVSSSFEKRCVCEERTIERRGRGGSAVLAGSIVAASFRVVVKEGYGGLFVCVAAKSKKRRRFGSSKQVNSVFRGAIIVYEGKI
ncbi:unnamed protein product, partial [Ectocarpus fasciculatus]